MEGRKKRRTMKPKKRAKEAKLLSFKDFGDQKKWKDYVLDRARSGMRITHRFNLIKFLFVRRHFSV